MNEERRFLTAEEAISLLNDGDNIHTFVNPNGSMLIGADWSREKVISLFEEHSGKIEIGGNMCRGMSHALIVWRGTAPLFVENNKEKLEIFDPITA